MNQALLRINEALEKISEFDEYEPAGPAARVAKDALQYLNALSHLTSQSDVVAYGITLQQIIEAICTGTKLPVNMPDLHHYKMAEKYLASQKLVEARIDAANQGAAAQEPVYTHGSVNQWLLSLEDGERQHVNSMGKWELAEKAWTAARAALAQKGGGNAD